MLSYWITVATSAAAYIASSGSGGVAAFNLQGAPSSGTLGLGWSQLARGMGILPANTNHRLTVVSGRGAPLSQLRLSPPFAMGNGEMSEEENMPDGSALAMASFLRCHKPLLNDRTRDIPDGNLCMLLRGCDAHQRMISLLELKTNAYALPGAAAAEFMATKGQATAQALCEQLTEKLASNSQEYHGLRLIDLLKLEVAKVHRVLQYAAAAGLKRNFLNRDALQVMLELYEEAGLDSDYIMKVLEGLRGFYKAEMNSTAYKDFFLPAYEEVIAKFLEAKKLVRPAEQIPFASLPFEPTPDRRTLTPLVVDIMAFKDKLPKLKAWDKK